MPDSTKRALRNLTTATEKTNELLSRLLDGDPRPAHHENDEVGGEVRGDNLPEHRSDEDIAKGLGIKFSPSEFPIPNCSIDEMTEEEFRVYVRVNSYYSTSRMAINGVMAAERGELDKAKEWLRLLRVYVGNDNKKTALD